MRCICFPVISFCAILAFLFISCGCRTSYYLNSRSDFKNLLYSDSNRILLRNNYDLSQKRIYVECIDKILVDGSIFFVDKGTITLEEGQIILLPDECVLLNEDCSLLLGHSFYEAETRQKGYVASVKRDKYKCEITEKLSLKPGSVLKFSGGCLTNAVIDMHGSVIEAPAELIFKNSIVINIGNKIVQGRWFFKDKQDINSEALERLCDNEIDFNGMSLSSNKAICVTNAKWKNLHLTAPQIYIGDSKSILSGFTVSKTDKQGNSLIATNVDLSPYKGYIALLSFGEHVHYDWREKNDKPTLFRGVTTIITETRSNSIIIDDIVESFKKEYIYISTSNKKTIIPSLGYIYQPCQVKIDSCHFFSTGRINPGFMYIYSGKDISIKNSSWNSSSYGTPSLLGINSSVKGVVENCSFIGAYYEGTTTSYGLQLFGSTRIIVRNCIFEGNRRGLDFSGNLCQSRYCTVENSRVIGDIIDHSGSGLGGHSTSYMNVYRNNVIEGSSSRIGIQTRGDYEIVEGNLFKLPFTAAAITCVENTIIRNNECEDENTSTFVWIESISREGNNILVENNKFKGNYFVRGQKELTCNITINGNTFRYASPTSSFAPVGDNVTVRSVNNKLIRDNEQAVLYFKYNNTSEKTITEGLGARDKVDNRFNRNGQLLE